MRSIYSHYGAIILFSIGAASLCGGCTSNADAAGLGANVESTGRLRLPIVTPSGATFRLRNGLFDVTGPAGAILALDSEAAADATELTADLDQGSYAIRLQDGWSLERPDEQGTFSPVRAALVSPNPANFEIKHERATDLIYSFATDEGLVTFGRGSLAVSIEVSQAPKSANCDLVSQSGCPDGQSCLLLDESGDTFCAQAGAWSVGSACSSEQCVPGSQCLKLDSEQPDQGVCAKFCNTSSPAFGCDCHSLSFSAVVGVCQNPILGACDPVSQSGCADGEACQYDGGSSGTCGTPGAGAVGSSCLGDTCAAGLDCHGDQPDAGVSGTCWRFCDTRVANNCGYMYGPYYYGYTSCRDTGNGTLGLCMP